MRALFIPLPQASESSLEGGIKRSISFRIGDLSNAASSHIEGVTTGANGLPITSSLKQKYKLTQACRELQLASD